MGPQGAFPPDAEKPGLRELAGRLRVDLSPLRESRPFLRLWVGQAISSLGSQAAYVALSYQVYALTQSTFAVGLLALAELIPLLSVTLVGGALADAFDRRRLMLVQQAGMVVGAAIALANAMLSEPRVWPCFLAALVFVSSYAFGAGAQNAIVPHLVPDGKLAAATNVDAIANSLANVAGPAVGGLFIGTTGVVGAYWLDLATFAFAIAAVWALPPIRPLRGADDARPSLRSIGEGFRFIRSNKVILGFLLVDTNAMIFGMPTALFPALATHRFHNPALVGYLYAATYLGALAASTFGGWVNHVRRQGLVVVAAAATWGAAIAAFGFATQLWLALVLLAVAGGADLVSAVLRGTMLLELTPDALRGRLTGIEFAQVASAPALGNLEAGTVAALTSLRTSIVSGGIACIVGCVAIGLAFPALMRYDARNRRGRPHAAAAT